jgi:hypothetical protein
MATQDDRNLSEALVKFGRDQGQMLALHKGEGWQGMLKDMLRITEHKQTRQEIRHVLAQVEKAVVAMRGR